MNGASPDAQRPAQPGGVARLRPQEQHPDGPLPRPTDDAPGTNSPAAGDQGAVYQAFLAEAERQQHARRKRAKRKHKNAPVRADDWADPDLAAPEGLPSGQHPVDRMLARRKEGDSRNTARAKLRAGCDLLKGLPVGSSTHEDTRRFAWHQLTVADAASLREAIYARHRPQSSRNDYVSVVRVVLKECSRAGLISALRLERLYEELYTVAPAPSRRGRMLTTDEVAALLRVCAKVGSARARARNTAVAALFLTSGIRVGELVNLDVAHWDSTDQTLLLVGTKNQRDHVVYLHPTVTDLLHAWLAVRGPASGPLFSRLTRMQPKRVSRQSIAFMLNDRAKRADIPPFSPHDFRRTFASVMLAKHDTVLVSHLLNHKKVQSTMIYDRRGDEARRQAIATLNLPTPTRPPTEDSTGDGTDGCAA